MSRFINSADYSENNEASNESGTDKRRTIWGRICAPRRQRCICGRWSDRTIISVFMGPDESGRPLSVEHSVYQRVRQAGRHDGVTYGSAESAGARDMDLWRSGQTLTFLAGFPWFQEQRMDSDRNRFITTSRFAVSNSSAKNEAVLLRLGLYSISSTGTRGVVL